MSFKGLALHFLEEEFKELVNFSGTHSAVHFMMLFVQNYTAETGRMLCL